MVKGVGSAVSRPRRNDRDRGSDCRSKSQEICSALDKWVGVLGRGRTFGRDGRTRPTCTFVNEAVSVPVAPRREPG